MRTKGSHTPLFIPMSSGKVLRVYCAYTLDSITFYHIPLGSRLYEYAQDFSTPPRTGNRAARIIQPYTRTLCVWYALKNLFEKFQIYPIWPGKSKRNWIWIWIWISSVDKWKYPGWIHCQKASQNLLVGPAACEMESAYSQPGSLLSWVANRFIRS